MYGVDRSDYEKCDDVITFFAPQNLVSSIEINLKTLLSCSVNDLVGTLLFIEFSPEKIYLIRPDIVSELSAEEYLDISSMICFCFPKTAHIEIEDFFNDDDQSDDASANGQK